LQDNPNYMYLNEALNHYDQEMQENSVNNFTFNEHDNP
jgi:hypothetical protein